MTSRTGAFGGISECNYIEHDSHTKMPSSAMGRMEMHFEQQTRMFENS